MKILALDIGGTAVKYGIAQNHEILFGQFPVREPNGRENIPERIGSFAQKYMPDSVAVSVPGPFDFETGTSLMTHKLPSMYKICMKEKLKRVLPSAEITFMHDSTAFTIGVLNRKPELKREDIAVLMLGTGLGYSLVRKGEILLNKNGSPLRSLWNQPFSNGTVEDFISAKTLISEARKCGFCAGSVRDMADAARNGNRELYDVFFRYGKNLGICVTDAKKEDRFSEIVIGGQISRSFDLIVSGFESTCKTKYSLTDEPDKCAVFGLIEYARNGKESSRA